MSKPHIGQRVCWARRQHLIGTIDGVERSHFYVRWDDDIQSMFYWTASFEIDILLIPEIDEWADELIIEV